MSRILFVSRRTAALVASEENGLTCWNTETGHGAFMNRYGADTF